MPTKMVYRVATVLTGLLFVAWFDKLCAQEFGRFTMHAGGGISVPLNPTANYVEVSENFAAGAGFNIGMHNSILGEFLWSGLPPEIKRQPLTAPSGSINLYTAMGAWRYHIDAFRDSPFGAYVVGGGGWYYRRAALDKNFLIPFSATCTQAYYFWGYGCDENRRVAGTTIVSHGDSTAGVNGGLGFTYGLGDTGLKVFVEARYHYAWTRRVPTTLIPVTFGIRYN